MDDTKNKQLLAFTQELKNMDLYPGQFEAVINAYKNLEESEKNELSSTYQEKAVWNREQIIGSVLIIASLISTAIYIMILLPNNKLLIGSITLLIAGILFLFGKNLVEMLLVKLNS
ncbi:MAG: hypothetical protein JU82_09065 [Sulfuricurvum sp. MLSB]|uniref:hypothetical protein n=1 Tax=Sulfuricurvum sp. MLSB TaxID=1537917 RepID=UPI0005055DAB|nr:hypothetical protein [Sulfuricurvum sp. MLSB]KFN39005.1 MAG: hypothetical protein JU82_09065 [Sulfuricurvum sp. MLSB]